MPALEAIREQRPDVLILDALMPDLDGLEVCKRLRSDEKLKGLPIIILTAAAELEKRAIAAGADAFLGKRFDLDVLLSRVEENRARG
ncbi:MAG: response regulator [Candidatus Dormibacteria bacterium]